jgi:hypothetical protein
MAVAELRAEGLVVGGGRKGSRPLVAATSDTAGAGGGDRTGPECCPSCVAGAS